MRRIRHYLATVVATIAAAVAMGQVSEAQPTRRRQPTRRTPEDAGAPVPDAGASNDAGATGSDDATISGLGPNSEGPPTSPGDGCEDGRRWCRTLRERDPDAYFLCVDARNINHLDHFFLVPDGLERTSNIFLPNRRLIVATRTQGGTRLSVSVPDEQIGIEMPRVDVPSSGRLGTGPTLAGAQETASDNRCHSNSVFSAPALRSGTGRITIKHGDDTLLAVPFVVDVIHAGAVRLGVASVFGPAVSHQYNVLTAPGSGQREIGLSFSGGAEFELVVGASAFVWDLLSARNGRTYVASRPWWSYALPSPYVGLGVVGTLGDKFTAFQSLHLGGEWEFTRSFTIGVTAVLRRTTRLNDGLFVGSPVSDDDIGSSTHQELNWGLGLVVNFSPEFLQVMTPGTRSSSSGGN